MVTTTRRPRPPRRRPAFSLRQLSVSFGLLAIGVTGVGLTLRKAMAYASAHPGPAVVVGLVVVGVVALLLPRRGRRGPADVPLAEEAASRPVVGVDPRPLEIDDYAAMEADAFEEAVAGLCRRDGCEDVRVVGGAYDLGADVVAVAPDGRNVVIQCKRYGEDNKVGSQELQRFGGTCFTVHGAEVAAVVTTSAFTDPAREYAEQCAILCFDHDDLVGWASGSGPAPWE
ncbi:restriction endonuclease [Streptomyces sp. NPDC021749]|uniref:restriction endonuclease n=1 Tax=Streptomyces sp. NPDC021749 TaxID=3154905 RepID=UPI0033D8115D